MKSRLKTVTVMVAMIAVGLVAGCGGGSGSTPTSASSTSPGSSPSSSPTASASAGAALYASNCAACHGALAVSSKTGVTLARLQAAIANNTGGMSFLSSMSLAQEQSIVDALNPAAATPAPAPAPAPTPGIDGVALYSANCAGCHGDIATSAKLGITLARLQTAISSNTGGMSFLSTLTPAQQQAIVDALNPAASTPTPTPTPAPTVDGAALYSANCAGCHGALATSAKLGITLARLQTAIANNTGGMSFLSTLTPAQQQAIVTALAVTTTPTPTPTPTPVTDGATLYTNNCSGCHGALATSAKAGATATRIQTAINANTGGMGSLASLTATQVSAIATALSGIAPSPTPTPACGSCHAIPPATGHHSTHKSEGISCAVCHGAGYSTTTVNAATHNNGVKNLTTTIGWNATNRSCSNSCHGTHTW